MAVRATRRSPSVLRSVADSLLDFFHDRLKVSLDVAKGNADLIARVREVGDEVAPIEPRERVGELCELMCRIGEKREAGLHYWR